MQSTFSHPKYRPDIDGLRAIAVLSVVIFHAFPDLIKGGFIGVDIFFVISGYLITTIIFENLDKGTFSFQEFYSRRVNRIFPALLLVLFASLLFGWFLLLADEYKQLGKHITAGAGFVSNLVLWSESGYFDNSAETKPLLHLWSLGIEEQFYIFWPLIIWFAWKKRLNLFSVTFVAAFVSFYFNIQGVKADATATFYSPLTRFWELLFGSLLAWLVLYKKDALLTLRIKLDTILSFILYREKPDTPGKALSNLISFGGLGLLLFGLFTINKDVYFPGAWALIPVVGATLIIASGPESWFNRVVLSNKAFVWIGLISYPLYLWHWPLLTFSRLLEGEVPSITIRLCMVALAFLLAWLTYKLFELPLRKFNKSNVKPVTLLVLLMAIGSIGYTIYSRDGFSSTRFKSNELSIINATLPQHSTEYTPYNFRTLMKNTFDENSSKAKILIIGDSYAQDLVNALYESKLNSNLQIITRHISKRCGNLFIEQSIFIQHIKDVDVTACRKQRLFEDKSLRNTILAADEVWMASSWQDWQAELIEQSVKSLKTFSKKKVIVFGLKTVGKINPRKLLELDEIKRSTLKNPLPIEPMYVNRKMKNKLLGHEFVDVQEMFCGRNPPTCSPFTRSGDLVSYDGTHLTREGAIFYGSALKKHELIKSHAD